MSGVKREAGGGVFGVSKMAAVAAVTPPPPENRDSEMEADPVSVKSPLGNGDTINLSEGEDNAIVAGKSENGVPQGSVSGPGTPQNTDSEMQVDQTPDRTDPEASPPVALSNGDAAAVIVATATDIDLVSAETACSPIELCQMHSWALRDHRLYCRPGTWRQEEGDGSGKERTGKDGSRCHGDDDGDDEEDLEWLTDMVHDFLESFYIKYGSFIPLSETDVLEHLRKEKKKKDSSDLSNKGLNIQGEVTRYRAALASAPVSGFMVMYNKHTLSLDDLGTLEEQNWLNDQIINMYGELIMEATQHKVHFFNSFFHKQLVAKGYDGVKRWTKKVDLFSKWLLLIPIHLEIHWSLVTVTMATKTINYYDSQGIVFRHTTENIMKYLQSEAREKKQTSFQKGWKITIIKGIPQQKNDSDCGVFVLEYCRRLSVKQPLLFSQDDMPRIRKRLYKELCDCRLDD